MNKKLKISALRVFLASITTAMTLQVTGCKKEQGAITNSFFINVEQDSNENDTLGNTLKINFHKDNADNISYEIDIDDHKLCFNQLSEVLEFITNCSNINKVWIYAYNQDSSTDVASICKSIPNPKEINDIEINTTVNSIDFLQDFENLEYLRLSDTSSADLDIIQNFKQLKALEIHHSTKSDFSFLKNLDELIDLNLSDNPNLKDIEFLRNLKKLTALNLSCTGITNEDTEILKTQKNLGSLYLYKTSITNLEWIKNLKKLFSFGISDTQIESFEPLESLPKLIGLYIPNTNLKSLYYIKNLHNLVSVDVSCNGIHDIAMIYGKNNFPNLESIDLNGNLIPDIQLVQIPNSILSSTSMNQLSKTTTLSIDRYNKNEYSIITDQYCYTSHSVQSLSYFLKSCTQVTHITYDDSATEVPLSKEELEAFSKNPNAENIKSFYIRSKGKNLGFSLSNYTNLETLIISGLREKNSITNLQNYPLENLQCLRMNGTTILHKEELAKCEHLKILQSTSVNLTDTDIQTLTKLPNLQYIDLRNSFSLTDYTPIFHSLSEKELAFVIKDDWSHAFTQILHEDSNLQLELFDITFNSVYIDLDSLKEWEERVLREKNPQKTFGR